jgi:RNA polymerase sigma-70 factor (ECF subfamily)
MDITLSPVINLPACAWPGSVREAVWLKPLYNQVETNSENLPMFSDEQLVENILNKGDPHHFRMLIARYQAKVHAIALSVLGPGKLSDAEDVAQEVFVKIYRQLDSFRGQSKFSTWLYRISINLAIDHQRKQNRHKADNLDQHPEPVSGHHAEQAQLEREQVARVESAVAQLNPRLQMIIRLFYWQGFKTREIAEVLATPEGTIKVYLLRARKILAGKLEELKP